MARDPHKAYVTDRDGNHLELDVGDTYVHRRGFEVRITDIQQDTFDWVEVRGTRPRAHLLFSNRPRASEEFRSDAVRSCLSADDLDNLYLI